MLTNTDITIYNRIYNHHTGLDTWKKTYVPEAWWFYDAKSTVTTGGTKNTGNCIIRIPDISVVVKRDDYIVKGDCSIEMVTVKDLQKLEYIKVLGANCNTFGGSQHIKVVGA